MIIKFIKAFISQHSNEAAQERRRNDLAYCGGFTIPEFKKYLDEKLKETNSQVLKISETVIGKMFIAPKTNYKNAKYYKEILNVKKMGVKYFYDSLFITFYFLI